MNFMKTGLQKSAITMIYSAVFILIISGSAYAESLFLRDGSIVEGKIIKESDADLQFELPDGTSRKLLRKEIIRTLYHDDYKNKRYLNKMDGDVLEVYIVDEDKASYTYRSNLNIANEVKILRTDVDSISKRLVPVAKEEPKKKFGVGVAFRTYFFSGESSNPQIPYMESTTLLSSTESEKKDHVAVLIEPFYDISSYVTIKTSFELTEKKIQASGGYEQYEEGGISSFYFNTFAMVQLNIPFSGFAPFLSGGMGYMFNLSGDPIEIQYGSYPKMVEYEFTPERNNLLVYRLALGVTIDISRTVDLVFSVGYDGTVGTPFYDGFTVKRNDGGFVDSELSAQAADLKSQSKMGMGYFQAGVSFRIF